MRHWRPRRCLAPRKRHQPPASRSSDPGHDVPSYDAATVIKHRHGVFGNESDLLAALLARLPEGDIGAFAALYDRTCARLYGLALQVLRDPASAQQATQEVYRRIWATADRFELANGSAQAWLTTLTHRVAVAWLRAEPRRTARILGCNNGNCVGGCHCVADEVHHHLAGPECDALNDGEREAIALAYYRGLTYQEVAEFLGDPVPTVASRIRAGLIRLTQAAGTG